MIRQGLVCEQIRHMGASADAAACDLPFSAASCSMPPVGQWMARNLQRFPPINFNVGILRAAGARCLGTHCLRQHMLAYDVRGMLYGHFARFPPIRPQL